MTGVTARRRIGIVGCGRMGRAHAERIRTDPRADVVGLTDVDRSAADRLREQLAPEATVHDSLGATLAAGPLDGVVIGTPTDRHFEQIMECRAHDVAVLCEKPLADTRERIASVISATAAGGAPLMLGYQRRFWSAYRTIRREVLSRQWGPVRAITSVNVENWEQTIGGTWRDDPGANPGGFIGDAGSHKIDIAFYTTGLSAREVFARLDNAASQVEILGSVSAVLEGGTQLTMSFVGNAQSLDETLCVHCENADLIVRERTAYIVRDGVEQPVTPIEPDSNPTFGFLDLLDGGPNIAPPECARAVADFTNAIRESHATGRSVSMA